MPQQASGLAANLSRLRQFGDSKLLLGTQVGLEKEGLRVSGCGGLATSPHPVGLGSALGNPWITTDYSEALLELVTPPCAGNQCALDFLQNLHIYTYQQLCDEIVWASSMPCILSGEGEIPIAQYGASNAGMMKHIYRVGLGHRYGRTMQVIAGIHYNTSFSDDFWQMYQSILGASGSRRKFVDVAYMGMIRNIQRIGWLIPYLFGASPAVCKSFFEETPNLPEFDETTYFEPWATSLRTGDIGYQNSQETGMGVNICYDSLATYIQGLEHATSTPGELWERIGIKVNGEYRQLNANILQIENEYYSSVRPKQPPQGLEKPIRGLQSRGIQYLELRSLDLNPYLPLGLDRPQLEFLEVFMLYCLLTPSPPISLGERWEIDRNLVQVAHSGRAPGFKLLKLGARQTLLDWANEITSEMESVAELLDSVHGGDARMAALRSQQAKVVNPDLTPSAQLLAEMRTSKESFHGIGHRYSQNHDRYFRSKTLDTAFKSRVDAVVADSLREQAVIDARQEVDFDTFLADYQSQ